MKVISVANLKGGSGKTTLSINLAINLNKLGYKTLLCDLDPNNNASDYFLRKLGEDEIESRNILTVLSRQMPLEQAIYETEHSVDVIPSTISLNKLDATLNGNPAPLLGLRSYLSRMDFDYIVMDCPPHTGAALRAGLYSADLVLCPISGTRWVFQGLRLLEAELNDARIVSGHNKSLLLVPSMSSTGKLELEKLKVLRKHYPVATTQIPRNTALRNMADSGKVIKDTAKISTTFTKLTEEMLVWLNPQKNEQQPGLKNNRISRGPVVLVK